MPLLHRTGALATACVLIGTSLLSSSPGASADSSSRPCTDIGGSLRYVVLFEPTTSRTDAEGEIEDQCGSVAAYYPEIGVGVVDAEDDSFGARLGPDRAYSAQRETPDTTRLGHQSISEPAADRADQTAEQWNMTHIHADQARARTRGEGVVVGVLDSAIDARHPELAEAIDPALSADCVRPESTDDAPPGGSPHGTHVAGIIAAADDGRGVTGVAPGARLASIRVVDDEGYVHPEYAVCGFMQAVDAGARVVNSSFLVESAQQGCGDAQGSPVPREAVRRATAYATSQGVLTVAATGNERVDLSANYGPRQAACDTVPVGLDGVLSVSAVDDAELKAGYSSYGLGAVDLAAPGGDSSPGGRCVLSTVPGSYDHACGTSMAAPHVAGVAALVAALHPDASPAELTSRLTERAEPRACPADYDLNADTMQDALCRGYATYNGFYGHGLVDALGAVSD